MGVMTGVDTSSVGAAEASGEESSLFSFCILITASRTSRSSPISPERERQLTCSLASRPNRMERSSEHSGLFSGSSFELPSGLTNCLSCTESPKLGGEGGLPNGRLAVGKDAPVRASTFW
jgi:hypothetical protein